jgi:hypothetical protein
VLSCKTKRATLILLKNAAVGVDDNKDRAKKTLFRQNHTSQKIEFFGSNFLSELAKKVICPILKSA